MDNEELNIFNFGNSEVNSKYAWGGIDPFSRGDILNANVLDLPIYPTVQNNLLSESLQQVKELLTDFLSQTDSLSRLQVNFGENWDIKAAVSSLEKIVHGQDFPHLTFLPDNLLSARGAFSDSNNTIYLSQQFLETANSQTIVSVLLEELGHYLDSQLNPLDSPGDEGYIFATLVQNKSLTEDKLHVVQNENDQAILNYAGQSILVEQSSGKNDHILQQLATLDDVFVVSGEPGTSTTLRFQQTKKDATYQNEIGVFLLDDEEGRINGIAPGAEGYAQAVLSSSKR